MNAITAENKTGSASITATGTAPTHVPDDLLKVVPENTKAKVRAEPVSEPKKKKIVSTLFSSFWLNLLGKGTPTGHKPKKAWFWIFGALSALYIFFEFSFNAELVNFASSVDINSDDLDLMARKGEVLSGLGMMLLLMGFADKQLGISKRFGVIASMILMTGLGYYSIQFMTWFQPTIVEAVVSRSSAEDRAKALNMTLFKHGAAEGSIVFNDTAIGSEPRDRVLLALLGPMAFANEQTQEKLFESQSEIIKNLVLTNAGSNDKTGWESYLSIRQSVRRQYDSYIAQARKAHDAQGSSPDAKVRQGINQLKAMSTAKYNAYQKASNTFKRHNPRYTPASFLSAVGYPPNLSKMEFLDNPKVCSEAYAEMHKKGIKVSAGWCPWNEGAIGSAIISQARTSVDSAWSKKSRELFGQVVSKNLSEKQFRELPKVKRSISQSLSSLPCAKGNAYLTAEQFHSRCILPDLNKGLDSMMEAYSVEVHKLADGGEFEDRGKTAVRALVIPPVAILFSLFFSLFALTKYFGRYRTAAVVGLIFIPMLLPMPNSEIAGFLLGSNQGSFLSTLAIMWVMTVEPAIYRVSQGFVFYANTLIELGPEFVEIFVMPIWQDFVDGFAESEGLRATGSTR